MLNYKGYIGHIVFDDEAEIFHGEVINIRDIVTFQGESVAEIKQAFVDSIDDYLAFCAENGESPDKPFSGKFNLRIDPELHRAAVIASKQSGSSLNNWISNVIQQAVNNSPNSPMH